MSRLALGPTQPPIQWKPGALSPGVKWPGRDADHSPITSADIKKTWVYTSTPPRLHGIVLNELSKRTSLLFALLINLLREKLLYLLPRMDSVWSMNDNE
jgi:hypothetical protein